MTTTKLSPFAQEFIARRLVSEYANLGVTIEAAREEVLSGKWDDHPAVREAQEAECECNNAAQLMWEADIEETERKGQEP